MGEGRGKAPGQGAGPGKAAVGRRQKKKLDERLNKRIMAGVARGAPSRRTLTTEKEKRRGE